MEIILSIHLLFFFSSFSLKYKLKENWKLIYLAHYVLPFLILKLGIDQIHKKYLLNEWLYEFLPDS